MEDGGGWRRMEEEDKGGREFSFVVRIVMMESLE